MDPLECRCDLRICYPYIMKSITSTWILYNLVVCFAVYWLSNLVLWYPWSIDETLGQVLMLTINPVLWGFASYLCFIKYPKKNMIYGVLFTSIIFVVEAMSLDFIFFAAIRNAMDKLMQPTTFYGWGFVLVFPFLVYLLFRNWIERNRVPLVKSDFWKPLLIGLASFGIIVIILVLNIQFN